MATFSIEPSKTSDEPDDAAQAAEAGAAVNSSDGEIEPEGKPESPHWPSFLENAREVEIGSRYTAEAKQILVKHPAILKQYCVLAIFEPDDSIGDFELDRVYSGLTKLNADRGRDVLLVLHTRGGSIEAAYQISKLCHAQRRDRFIVVVPRLAKSAGTLAALGADEIHMGPLSQLGPIDPQLGSEK